MKEKAQVAPGDQIHIYHLFGDSSYRDTEGVVQWIDHLTDSIYGSWGPIPLLYTDDWVIIDSKK